MKDIVIELLANNSIFSKEILPLNLNHQFSKGKARSLQIKFLLNSSFELFPEFQISLTLKIDA